jgi:hypothetical protein
LIGFYNLSIICIMFFEFSHFILNNNTAPEGAISMFNLN